MASFKTAGPNQRLSMLLASMGMPHDPRPCTPSTASTTLRSTCKPCREAFTSTPGYDPGEDEETDMSYDEQEKMMNAKSQEDVRERMRNTAPGRLRGGPSEKMAGAGSEIPRELDDLRGRVEQAMSMVQDLRNRIDPVLLEQLPEVAGESPCPPEPGSTLACGIRATARDVDRVIAIVQDMHERLAL